MASRDHQDSLGFIRPKTLVLGGREDDKEERINKNAIAITFTDSSHKLKMQRGNVDGKPTTTVSAFQEPPTQGTAGNKTSADFTITKHFTYGIPCNSHSGRWARREFK